MALINCSECGKEISDKATSCPNCGVPLNHVETISLENNYVTELLTFPELPTDLNIGKQISNWNSDAAFSGFLDKSDNIVTGIPHGKVSILLHTHGIQIMGGITMDLFQIHNSQIISLYQKSQEEIIRTNKSVIGRAVVGGLILGPLGAIVGGMSGIGSKEKFINKTFLIINYWDTETKSAQTILISSTEKKEMVDAFIKRHEKEKERNFSEKRIAEKNTLNAGGIAIIICIIIAVVTVLAIAYTYM